MVVSEKTMDALKGIGLNLYERKIWVSLLAKGTATAGELAEMSNVPRSRCYDTLESLAEKGLVIIQPGKPIKFVAVAPEQALENVKKKIEEKLRSLQAKVDELKNSEVLKELNQVYQKSVEIIQPEDVTGTLKGKFMFYRQFENMIKNAKKKINILASPKILNEIFTNYLELLKEAKEKGIDINIAVTTAQSLDILQPLSQIAKVKVLNPKTLPVYGNLVLVDEKELLFDLTNPKVDVAQGMALWTKSEHATSNLMEPFFKLIWDKAKTFK